MTELLAELREQRADLDRRTAMLAAELTKRGRPPRLAAVDAADSFAPSMYELRARARHALWGVGRHQCGRIAELVEGGALPPDAVRQAAEEYEPVRASLNEVLAP